MSTNDQPNVQPDLMGYPSVEALAQAKRASDAEAQRIVAESRKKDEEIALLRNQVARPDIPQRSGTPTERLNEYGIPVDALDQFFNERLQQAFAPVAAAAGARSTVLASNPDYAKFEAEIAADIAKDPEMTRRYQTMFQADPVGAIEWSIAKFTDGRKGQVPNEPEPGVRRARAEAQIPSSRGATSREPSNQLQEAVEDARKRALQTRNRQDVERFASLRLRQAISPRFYQTGHPESG